MTFTCSPYVAWISSICGWSASHCSHQVAQNSMSVGLPALEVVGQVDGGAVQVLDGRPGTLRPDREGDPTRLRLDGEREDEQREWKGPLDQRVPHDVLSDCTRR